MSTREKPGRRFPRLGHGARPEARCLIQLVFAAAFVAAAPAFAQSAGQPPAATTASAGPQAGAKIEPGTYAGHFWSETMTIVVERVAGGKVYGTGHAVFDNGFVTANAPFVAAIGPDGRTFSWVNRVGSTTELAPCPSGLCGVLNSKPFQARTNVVLARQK